MSSQQDDSISQPSTLTSVVHVSEMRFSISADGVVVVVVASPMGIHGPLTSSRSVVHNLRVYFVVVLVDVASVRCRKKERISSR